MRGVWKSEHACSCSLVIKHSQARGGADINKLVPVALILIRKERHFDHRQSVAYAFDI